MNSFETHTDTRRTWLWRRCALPFGSAQVCSRFCPQIARQPKPERMRLGEERHRSASGVPDCRGLGNPHLQSKQSQSMRCAWCRHSDAAAAGRTRPPRKPFTHPPPREGLGQVGKAAAAAAQRRGSKPAQRQRQAGGFAVDNSPRNAAAGGFRARRSRAGGTRGAKRQPPR